MKLRGLVLAIEKGTYNFPMAHASPYCPPAVSRYLADEYFHRNLITPSAVEPQLIPCTLDIYL